MVHEIRCSDEEHATRAGEPGFADVVGTIDLLDGLEPTPAQLAGARCTACARAQASPPATAAAAARARGLLPVDPPEPDETPTEGGGDPP